MNTKKILKYWTSLVLALVCVLGTMIPSYAEEEDSSINRFNVVVVLDASESMGYTDPTGLRYEAISQFTNLLADQGNYLGGIAFSNHVITQVDPFEMTSQEDKNAVSDSLQSVTSKKADNEGYTNIGEALSTAVDLLNTKGNSDLPSVIVFLSDGNTEMPTDDELTDSLDQKAEAIQAARENDIGIYTVCLNANNAADTSEMSQISNATGGVFQEVSNAEDLQDVFNNFYSLIYGTSTITMADDVFPADGVLRMDFEVPKTGVEEVNIVINGSTTNISLESPDGTPAKTSQVSSEMYTLIKMSDIISGKWTLITEGVPGERIKINMIYNTNLGVNVETNPDTKTISTTEDFIVKATLMSGNTMVTSSEQYAEYDAKLCVMDAYGDEIDSFPMRMEGDHFEVAHQFEEGVYYINVNVSLNGHSLEKNSTNIGPITVKTDVGEGENESKAPVPVDTPVNKTVYIWPFKGGNLSVDMTTLATDAGEDSLKYEIVSSSFIEGTDYTVDGDVITMNHFSLSTGSYDIKATNSDGLSCNIELVVKSYNVGVLALIGIGICGLIALAVFLILLYIALTKPFRGTISAQSYSNGVYKGVPRMKKRGRIKLSAFRMDPVGLDYNKSYFQATGDNFVYLITNKPVIWNGQKTSKVRIQSGADVTITIKEGDSRLLYIRFDSRVQGGPRRPTTSTRRRNVHKRQRRR